MLLAQGFKHRMVVSLTKPSILVTYHSTRSLLQSYLPYLASCVQSFFAGTDGSSLEQISTCMCRSLPRARVQLPRGMRLHMPAPPAANPQHHLSAVGNAFSHANCLSWHCMRTQGCPTSLVWWSLHCLRARPGEQELHITTDNCRPRFIHCLLLCLAALQLVPPGEVVLHAGEVSDRM